MMTNTTTTETTENAPQVFEIPRENVEALEARLEKLAKRAAKLGAPISFTWGEDVAKTVRITCPSCEGRRCGFCEEGRVRRTFVYRPITVSTSRPKFAGWDFLGTLNHTEIPGQVLRLMVPGVEAPIEAVNAKPGQCDHCGKVRNRTETFVVRNGEAVKIVGRNCIADFLGHQSPAHLAAMLSFVAEVTGALEESESGGGGGRARWEASDTIRTLAGVFALARTEGYKPKKFEEQATSRVMSDLLWPGRKREEQEAARLFWSETVTLADFERAWAALAWLEAQAPSSDFLSNLRAVGGAPFVSMKTLGLFCAIVPAFDREAIRRSAPKAASVHVGEVGKRQGFGLGEVTRLFWFDTNYGSTAVVLIRLADGPVLKWMTSSLPEWVETGAKVVVAKATVKEHGHYETTPQTVVTRVQLEKAEEAA